LKILICHNRYQGAGGEDAVADAEAALLANHGHRVERWTVSNDVIRGARTVVKARLAAGTLWSFASYRELRRRLRRSRPDVAHFHNTFPLLSPSVYYACRAEGVPVVQTLHNYRLLCPAATFFRNGRICEDCLGPLGPWNGVIHGCYRNSRLQSAVTASMLTAHRMAQTWPRLVDVYIALTNFARAKFVTAGLSPEQVVVKPNFVTATPNPGNRSGAFALFVGRLSPEKGVRTLLGAWEHLDRPIPLRIVGTGPLAEEVRRAVSRIESLTAVGEVDPSQVSRHMSDAAFLVFPSECYEGLSLVLIEALAHATPVVASDLIAFDDLVQDGVTGWRFRTADVPSLAAAVVDAWGDREGAEQRGREARRLFEGRFTPEANYRQLLEIYGLAAARAAARSGAATLARDTHPFGSSR
jgi:glycosyltransferase involved in cell wall biosynthesis